MQIKIRNIEIEILILDEVNNKSKLEIQITMMKIIYNIKNNI
jgi:hypothetical protein